MRVCSDIQLVWFKHDLRVADHEVLSQAAQCGQVFPLFIVEPELWQQTDRSGRQWAFVAESIAALRCDLAALGQPLIVRIGDAVDVISKVCDALPNTTLWSHEETGNGWTFARDLRVAAWARSRSIKWIELSQSGVVRRLGTRDGWAKRWDTRMASPQSHTPQGLTPLDGVDPGSIPSAYELGLRPDPCPGRQKGGRPAGLDCLRSFLHVRGAPYRRAMSNPSEGEQHCSRISPHLAWGTLSMREVAQATWARQRELKTNGNKGGWRGSMSSFQARLHWRDHFTQKLEDEPSLEFRNLHRGYDGLRPGETDLSRLLAWSRGETGLPFVDACMRSLQSTGWLNFRMRAMMTAFASYHLWLDWRKPGEHLARMFTDYEPGIHWPQIQMQSGTTGINTVRIYNPVKQGYDQDPEGQFVRKWVPQLQDVPTEFIHEPWRWDQSSSLLDRAYPRPIIDHLRAAKDAREKVWAVRKNRDFRDAAQTIQHKHGSRRAGLRMRGQRRRSATDENQLAFSFQDDDGPLSTRKS
ncbi:MAG: FAD-binding domain-containing protein [Pseudomonadota bacterium]